MREAGQGLHVVRDRNHTSAENINPTSNETGFPPPSAREDEGFSAVLLMY